MKAIETNRQLPPLVAAGKNWKAFRRNLMPAKPPISPYKQVLTFVAHRDAETGRYAKRPPPVSSGRLRLPAPSLSPDIQAIKRVHHWDDGSSDVIGVKVKVVSARAAFRRGELKKSDLKEFERGLADDLLNELNPTARQEWELEQMHAAHNSAKGKRGAESKIRNDKARAEDLRVRGKAPAPAFEWGHSIALDTEQLAALLEAAQRQGGPVMLSLRKYQGSKPRLELRGLNSVAALTLEGH